MRTTCAPLPARADVLSAVIVFSLALPLGPTGCSLVFSSSPDGVPDSGTQDDRDADIVSDADGGPQPDAGDSASTIDCGSMSALSLDVLTPEDLAPAWSISGRSAEFTDGDMEVDTAGWTAVEFVALRGLTEYAAPFAFDLHVSQIPDEASARFLLKFEHNDEALNFVQVAITASDVRVFSSYTGSMDVSLRLAPTDDETDYYVRLIQADGTMEFDDSVDGLQWRRVKTLSVPNSSARPTIAARVSDDVIDPHPPMILHSLGSSCE